jgi:hypothetical protein
MKVEVQEYEHVEGRYNVKTSLATHARLATLNSKRGKKETRGKWRMLKELFECDFSVWEIENICRDNVFNASCSYKRSLKMHLCKHILGLAGRLEYVKFPTVAKNLPIGQKRKRGRPSTYKQVGAPTVPSAVI